MAATARRRAAPRRRTRTARQRPGFLVRVRRWTVGLLVLAAALTAAYLFWFRDLSMFEVKKVTLNGLTTSQEPKIRNDLERAARDMTTLHVDTRALQKAVGRYPVVAGLTVSPALPDGLMVTIRERPPGAVLTTPAGQSVPVAADGTVLPGVEAGEVAHIPVDALPDGAKVGDPAVAIAVHVASAAPVPLGAEVAAIEVTPGKPIVASMTGGTEVILGDAERLDEKWSAAAAALADPAIAAAEYVDVTLPDRPVAGGVAAVE
jgi:cell division septal protein FtsQ